MTTKTNDGGPAFPVQDRTNEFGFAMQPGMSLRDYFAAHAPVTFDQVVQTYCNYPNMAHPDERKTIRFIEALLRYEYADAMLAARQKGS